MKDKLVVMTKAHIKKGDTTACACPAARAIMDLIDAGDKVFVDESEIVILWAHFPTPDNLKAFIKEFDEKYEASYGESVEMEPITFTIPADVVNELSWIWK